MTDKINDGGTAFPFPGGTFSLAQPGMSLRDWFAGQAPITFGDAAVAYGRMPNFNQGDERAAFFAVWTRLRYEHADAMLAARKGDPR